LTRSLAPIGSGQAISILNDAAVSLNQIGQPECPKTQIGSLTGALERIFEVHGRLRDLAISPKYPEWIRVAILPLLDDALADLEQIA
jgi:hypothetical protein